MDLLFHSPQTTFQRKIIYNLIYHLCNVGPWQTANFHEVNNLYNVVSTIMGPHCIGILSSQCCPNTSETTLHQKNTCAMLARSAKTRFRRKISHSMLPWSAFANIAYENYLCIVDPMSKNNFAQESNIQCCLNLFVPKLRKEFTCAMLAQV